MTTFVTIYLTPALDGVVSEVGYFYDPTTWIKILDAPISVAGVIGPDFSVTVNGVPDTPLYIRIPSQTVGGITYEEALSVGWMKTATTLTDNITLVEVQEPTPPPPPPFEIKNIAIPGIVGVVLMVAILRV